MDKAPEVMPAAPLSRFHFRDNGGFLYKVSAEGCRIVLDVFHALADGTGSETFLLTLAGEYLRLKYGLSISYSGLVLNPRPSSPAGRANWKRTSPPITSRAAGCPERVSATSGRSCRWTG